MHGDVKIQIQDIGSQKEGREMRLGSVTQGREVNCLCQLLESDRA